MLLTTSHALGYHGDVFKVVSSDIARDSQDDEDGKKIEGGERKGSASDAGEDDGSESNSLDGRASPVTSDPIFPTELLVMRSQVLIGRGKAIVQVGKLDYALIELGGLDSTKKFAATPTPLEDWRKIVVHRDEPMQVKAETPSGGYIFGSRRPSLWKVRLPGSNEDLQVYAARFAASLEPGCTGSWVLDAESDNLLGHIITVGFFGGSEIALIMPAKDVFEHARDELDSRYEIN